MNASLETMARCCLAIAEVKAAELQLSHAEIEELRDAVSRVDARKLEGFFPSVLREYLRHCTNNRLDPDALETVQAFFLGDHNKLLGLRHYLGGVSLGERNLLRCFEGRVKTESRGMAGVEDGNTVKNVFNEVGKLREGDVVGVLGNYVVWKKE